ncbi:MAG: hypothetical protein LBS69_06860 [Prevotellaceae bacterium]|jgi:prepilin signal peptidase PulO-like enzyme (type II secretory pathway)|nr:hypothetical protein [Prevotellaceae bacterium]
MKQTKTQRSQKKSTSNINDFFERNKKSFMLIILAAGTLMSFLMFDIKASLGGDDSDYVLYADRFCHDFVFPGFRGPLYPIVLSPFVLIFGVNLVLLKSLSAIFILLSIWLLYKSFCNKIKAVILIPTLLLLSICSHVFFYAAYTYSEPFFMFVQALFIYFFSKYFLNDEDVKYNIKHDWRKYLTIGSLVLALGLTRSIGFGSLAVVILYFIIKSKWKDMLFTLSASGIVFFAFQIFKKIVWSQAGSAYDIKYYLAKNYYNINQGMEDFSGFVNRLIENSNVYISKFLYMFMGLRPENTQTVVPFLTVLTYVLFAICLISVFKKSKSLLFVGLYAGIMNFASFVILQSNWQQDRLIMIYYPLMLLFILGGIFYLFTNKKLRSFRFIYPLIIVIMITGNLSHSSTKIKANFPVLQRNLSIDRLAGLTPDWRNFILMSQWVSENIDKDIKVVSRKASISYIYTGRMFEIIASVPSEHVDSLLTIAPEGKSILIVDVVKMANVEKLMSIENLMPNLNHIITGDMEFEERNLKFVCSYIIDNNEIENIKTQLDELNLKYWSNKSNFNESCRKYIDNIYIYNPDKLLNNIEKNNIKYIIIPKLRLNPNENTGATINTISIYLLCIDMKYPNRFFTVHEIGTSESCELVEYAPNGIPTELNNTQIN